MPRGPLVSRLALGSALFIASFAIGHQYLDGEIGLGVAVLAALAALVLGTLGFYSIRTEGA